MCQVDYTTTGEEACSAAWDRHSSSARQSFFAELPAQDGLGVMAGP